MDQNTRPPEDNIYKTAFNYIDAGILLYDGIGKIINANRYILALSGYQDGELEGKSISSLLLNIKTDGDYEKDITTTLIKKSAEVVSVDIRFKKLSDNCTMAELNRTPLANLHESDIQSLLRFDDILIEYDAESGEIFNGNSSLAESMGIPIEKIIGKKLYDFLPGDIIKKRLSFSREAVKEGIIQTFNDTRENRSIHNIIIPMNQDNPNLVTSISIDITEHQKLLELSNQQSVQMELLVRNLPISLYTYVINESIESFHIHNDNFLGYSSETINNPSFKWSQIIHPDDQKAVAENTKMTISGTKEDIDYRFRARDGSWHWILDRGRLLKSESGKDMVYGALIDISDRKNMESRLKETLDQKEILMKEINHRVKNNLLMISSIISLKEADSGEDLSDISHQIDAIRIVHEKLYQSENVTEINFSEYCSDLINTISSSFFDYPISFVNKIPEVMIPTKKVIPLGLIVNELATNAIKHGFSPEIKSEISISLTDKDNGSFILVFSNSGKPIPEATELDNPKTLGLRLLQALLSQINGHLEVERSPHPVFTITFKIN